MRGLDRKSSRTDMVSDADRDAETLVVELLRSERPEDGLLGEEGSSVTGASGRRWVVDPLDGTTNFLYGFPAWSVSVALEDDAGSLAGVVFDPGRNELFSAARGEGARLNGEPLAVRDCERAETALVATGFSYEATQRALQAEVLSGLIAGVRDIRRGGSAALDLSWLAAGRLDGYYERGLKPWDWASGRLLVQEAGGVLAEMPGQPLGIVAACSEPLLAELQALLQAG